MTAEPQGRRQPSTARSRMGDQWQYTRGDGRPGRGDGGNNNNGGDKNNEATRARKLQGEANRARGGGRGLGIGVVAVRVAAQMRGKAS